PFFETKTTLASEAHHAGTLSHNAGDLIEIFSIGSSDARYFWDGDIAGKTPPDPKKVYISRIDLTNFVNFFDGNDKTLYHVTHDDSVPVDMQKMMKTIIDQLMGEGEHANVCDQAKLL
uniref:Uncharacterized protein n=1 Tax=Romanomermis culicivorax TaxID=13658 RepID=A0A915IA57_ROMCU